MPPRSRNFDGCWTCRRRKIKCDRRRPRCLRCVRAGFQCQGYGVALSWGDVASVGAKNEMVVWRQSRNKTRSRDGCFLRRSLALVLYPPLQRYELFAALTHALALLDEAEARLQNADFYCGPFGVLYPARGSAGSRPDASILSNIDNTFVHYKLLDAAKLTISAIKGPWYQFTEQGMYHILYPKFFVDVESDDWSASTHSLSDFFRCENGAVVVLPALADVLTSLAARNFALINIAHPNCCWDMLVVGKIKELLFELVFEQFALAGSWQSFVFDKDAADVPQDALLRNIKFCILCMAVAIGCFWRSWRHRPIKNPVDSYFVNDDLRASIELRKVAVNFLNYHLDEYDRSRWLSSGCWYDNYFLLALILQIHLDNSFGVFENYDLIYAVGECLEKSSDDGGRLSPLESYLRQTFGFLRLFYASTQSVNSYNYTIPPEDQHQKYRDLGGDYDLIPTLSGDSNDSDGDSEREPDRDSNRDYESAKSTVPNPNLHFLQKPVSVPRPDIPDAYVSLGLPDSLVQLFGEIVKLTNDKRIFRLNGITPRNYPRICAETKDKLLGWTVERHWNLYAHVPGDSTARRFHSRFHEGLWHHVQCFHSALVVYFERLISEVPVLQTQGHVRASMAAVQSLARVNEQGRDSDDGVSFACSFWPLLVCGADIDVHANIDTRAQCELMWQDALFSKYNYWRAKQNLFEIWHRQEEDREYNGFMDLVREWDIVLNL
ncbi:hypothetical protein METBISCDRAFT_16245 [Metschnikowia bicuspidata]|uniref:Zn(2)-C6 fungal-type domain-containing protein n=1 Tax=Metschnikowia bicuspidata TaxID=27322 RepID=A0A4P9ZCD6_9ASCO|nr:hypothetical protein METBISCDRAFT_16245 [Metschnikowia bicuspidata]